MTFHLEGYSILSDSILSNIPFWLIFNFFCDIPLWVTFNFEWYSILSDILFWVTFHFEWHSILCSIPIWVTGWCLHLNDENWGGIGLSRDRLNREIMYIFYRERWRSWRHQLGQLFRQTSTWKFAGTHPSRWILNSFLSKGSDVMFIS